MAATAPPTRFPKTCPVASAPPFAGISERRLTAAPQFPLHFENPPPMKDIFPRPLPAGHGVHRSISSGTAPLPPECFTSVGSFPSAARGRSAIGGPFHD